MARGISLHIGLNNVDISQYPGYTIPVLNGCINDANAMASIAKATGFSTSDLLLDSQATALAIKDKISEAASQLVSGDLFFLTYSGHGSQVPDEQGDEDDGSDETWITYDRQLLDDELYVLWQSFKENVRIFVLSDSCHSGTMVRMLLSDYIQGKTAHNRSLKKIGFNKADVDAVVGLVEHQKTLGLPLRAVNTGSSYAANPPKIKALPLVNSLNNYLLKKELYQNIQQLTRAKKDADNLVASLLYISGCQDNQTSGDGPQNGVFTGNLLQTWSNGTFDGTYNSFYNRILSLMPADQTPNYMALGTNTSLFEAQKPFTILAASTGSSSGGNASPVTSGKPGISGPSSWNANSLPPTFNIDKGANPYYYVEVATDASLFNNADHGSERTDGNFFATWNDASNGYKLFTESQYQLSQQAWDALKGAEKLFYRMGTTVDTKWTGWQVTLDDANYSQAPSLYIMKETTTPDETPDYASADAEDNKAALQSDAIIRSTVTNGSLAILG